MVGSREERRGRAIQSQARWDWRKMVWAARGRGEVLLVVIAGVVGGAEDANHGKGNESVAS